MPGLYFPPDKNALQKTLSAQLLAGGTIVNLSDTDGVANKPGIIVIDRVDANNVLTANKREYISYTGISGSTLTGLTRNVDNGGSDQNHEVGAVVEFVMDITWANQIATALSAVVNVSSATFAINNNILNVDNFDTYFVNSLASTATLSAKTLTGATVINKPTINASVQAYTTDTDGATITFDMASSNIHTVVLGGARTLAVSNVSVGQSFVIRLVQDGSGSRTVTWFSTIKWPNGVVPTLTTTLNKTDVFGFICTSSGNYDGYVVGMNL